MTERIRCCLPYCRHSTINKRGWSEWICREHWAPVPKKLKRVYTRVKRRRAGPADTVTDRIWRRLKRAAIERAAGI